ncbi:unnamed protein product [Leptosia nina]|uniref:Secreted protein n=1 Tax=Leptosia nina TaxID=320188 RepID=A0AAV1JFJ0_9NEOP
MESWRTDGCGVAVTSVATAAAVIVAAAAAFAAAAARMAGVAGGARTLGRGRLNPGSDRVLCIPASYNASPAPRAGGRGAGVAGSTARAGSRREPARPLAERERGTPGVEPVEWFWLIVFDVDVRRRRARPEACNAFPRPRGVATGETRWWEAGASHRQGSARQAGDRCAGRLLVGYSVGFGHQNRTETCLW